MKSELLPIGSVVLLEGGTKTLMITGYKMKENKDAKKVYDYVACVFPEGFMEQIYSLFDANQIKDVLFVGCMDGNEEYLHGISDGIASYNGLTNDIGSMISNLKPRKGGRRAPKNPLSLSEMRAKYSGHKISGGRTKAFDLEAYLAQDHSVKIYKK